MNDGGGNTERPSAVGSAAAARTGTDEHRRTRQDTRRAGLAAFSGQCPASPAGRIAPSFMAGHLVRAGSCAFARKWGLTLPVSSASIGKVNNLFGEFFWVVAEEVLLLPQHAAVVYVFH